jgi:hypothetical protein
MFQITVLYPWHYEYSKELKNLSKQVNDLNINVSTIGEKREEVGARI